ncbi:MAG: hypothetical protein A3J82_03180 [Elusimicrobia bacterium RIFOXYA2_FULL_69_6]|nr:MAG: hypothetical protein A3J82_03180 [Elusimicrobia bacterium RIFOXYA2_FULL_69_6]
MDEGTPLQSSPRRIPVLRFAAHVLYLPLLTALGCMAVVCLLMLVRGNGAGARVVLYGAMLYVVGRRYGRIYSGEIDGPQLWKDVAALIVIDLLLAALLLDFFS